MNRAIYLLSPTPYERVINLPIIEFETLNQPLELEGRDILIFTSKQAVKRAYAIDEKIVHYPALSIGSATKKALEALGIKVLHSASKFYGEVLAKDIQEKFNDKKLLYLRPQKVSTDIKEALKNRAIDIKEQIIYQTRCKEYGSEHKPPKGSIIIFTSPSTIRCFLQNFEWESSYSAVVIGKATLQHLPKEAHYEIAHQPLIDECIVKAKSLKAINSI